MKVILLKDIPGTGNKFDLKEVADGYARNFLLPRGFAKPATPASIMQIEMEKKRFEETKKKEEAQFKEALEKLKNISISIEAKITPKGGLFKKIGAKDIVKALEKENISGITEKNIILFDPIKQTGEYKIELKHREISGVITIHVKAK